MAVCLVVPALWVSSAAIWIGSIAYTVIGILMTSRVRFAHFRHFIEHRPRRRVLVGVSACIIGAGIAILATDSPAVCGILLLIGSSVYLVIARRIALSLSPTT